MQKSISELVNVLSFSRLYRKSNPKILAVAAVLEEVLRRKSKNSCTEFLRKPNSKAAS